MIDDQNKSMGLHLSPYEKIKTSKYFIFYIRLVSVSKTLICAYT